MLEPRPKWHAATGFESLDLEKRLQVRHLHDILGFKDSPPDFLDVQPVFDDWTVPAKEFGQRGGTTFARANYQFAFIGFQVSPAPIMTDFLAFQNPKCMRAGPRLRNTQR